MRKAVWGLVALLVALSVWWLLQQRAVPVVAPAAVEAPAESPPEAAAGRRRGRPAISPEPEVVERAASRMSGVTREGSCGPYDLLTDVAEPQLVTLCEWIGSELEIVYRERFGLQPVGEPLGAVLLFSRLADFRRFVAETTELPAGYAGLSSAWLGVVALHSEGRSPREVAQTLAHELTHLVHRRALGTGLPPWLSEGLADAIGDAADAEGLRPLVGSEGVVAQRARLLSAYRRGVARPLAELVELERGQFDRFDGVTPTYDYEQSALFVRFLLSPAGRRDGFRAFLAELAAGAPYEKERLRRRLGSEWPAVEADFERWLTAAGGA